MTRHRFLFPVVALLLFVCCGAPAEEKVLYKKQSPYSLITVTEDEQGLRTLLFDKTGVRQSVVKPGDPDHLGLPYTRAMCAALAFVEEPRRVLIVGLGGGAIPSFLHKHYPAMRIDVVDIDPDVVAVAKRFFGFREDSILQAHVADGRRFIETCDNTYDIIFLDAFSSDNIPGHLTTREFLAAVNRALSPKGIAVSNIWSKDSNSLYDSMVRTYQDAFGELHFLDVPDAGNEVLIAVPRPLNVKQDELARRGKVISQAKQLRFDMGDLIRQGYRFGPPKNLRGSVLRDKAKKAG